MGVLVITSTRQDLKTKGIIFRIKMKGLQILCLVGLSIASQQKLDSANAKMVNEMMDAVESGLETPGEGEARALFLTVTLTSTSTNLATATVTPTVTNTCAAVTYTGTCTTPTTAAPRNARDIVKYYLDGSEVPIHEIMPSTVDESRSDLDALNADLIMDADAPSVMSGSMSWSDVLVKKTPSACGRDAHDNHRRQRVIALANENVALNLTTTTTELSTAAATVTVSATLSCTVSSTISAALSVPLC